MTGLKGAVAICNHDDCIHIAFIACSDHWPGNKEKKKEDGTTKGGTLYSSGALTFPEL
jgi:hypothetical protein